MKKHKQELSADARDRIRAFIQARLEGKNGRQAAIEAGYPENSAHQRAWELHQRPDVQAALGREHAARDQLLRHTRNQIEAQLGYQGFSDVGLMFNEDGSLKKITEMPMEIRSSIASFEARTIEDHDGVRHVINKVRLAQRQQPLHDLAVIHQLIGIEPSIVNAPAFSIQINCERQSWEPPDEAPAVEVPSRERWTDDGSTAPAPGAFDRGGALALALADAEPADQPVAEASPKPPTRPPTRLETLAERMARAKAEAEAAHGRRSDEAAEQARQRAERQPRGKRPDLATMD